MLHQLESIFMVFLPHAVRSLACWAFFLFSAATVEPKKAPITERPTTRMKAGIRTAHSLAGKYAWIGLELSKKGWILHQFILNELGRKYRPEAWPKLCNK